VDVIRQHQWTEQELLSQGFHYISRRKQRILAARLPESRAPLPIDYEMETVYADAGDVICFEPGTERKANILQYNHWSVKPDIFLATYQCWDEPRWTPTPAELHLMKHGCRPYYKFKGAWAKQLTQPVYVQSLESPEPVLIPVGVWLMIGESGDPWTIGEDTLLRRYILPAVLYKKGKK
jgi:hypothetical protein